MENAIGVIGNRDSSRIPKRGWGGYDKSAQGLVAKLAAYGAPALFIVVVVDRNDAPSTSRQEGMRGQ